MFPVHAAARGLSRKSQLLPYLETIPASTKTQLRALEGDARRKTSTEFLSGVWRSR